MKNFARKFGLLMFLFFAVTQLVAQTTSKNYPETFTLRQRQIDQIFTHKPGARLSAFTSKYLAKGVVLANTKNGDTKYARVQLPYFNGAFLNVQVNGVYSTQVFILSSDKSVFYRTRKENGFFTFIKCSEDEIVSE